MGFLTKTIGVLAIAAGGLVYAVENHPDEVRSQVPEELFGKPFGKLLRPPLPTPLPIKEAHWLEQNWSTYQRHWFHHAAQGTATFPVPYDWFGNLEQPVVTLFSPAPLMKEPGYLEQFGFISSPRTLATSPEELARFGYAAVSGPGMKVPATFPEVPADNLDGLPIGIARTPGGKDPVTGAPLGDQIGLTCAACHTGQINYKGVSLRFDGGPAMIDAEKLEKSFGLALLYTVELPFRMDRFARRVLGGNASAEAIADVKKQVENAFDKIAGLRKLERELGDAANTKSGHKPPADEGFGRLDALNRIGNRVFFENLIAAGLNGPDVNSNYAVLAAPVSFPPIWTVPWLSWAQYDASIRQPLVRNAGEAMGVGALVNINPRSKPEELFRSSVSLANLDRFEKMLAGEYPFNADKIPDGERTRFKGLLAPQWPAKYFLNNEDWKINPERATRGRALYQKLCVECHLGPVNDPVFDAEFPQDSIWTSKRLAKDENGEAKSINPVQKQAADMGVDAGQANVLATRRVKVPAFLKIDPAKDLTANWGCANIPPTRPDGSVEFATALMDMVERVDEKLLESATPEQKRAVLGPRPNCLNQEALPNKRNYRARPLDGVWATAPYLHNGSVPSLWWMLSPARERPTRFCVGAREFDPVNVGVALPEKKDEACKKGEFEFVASSDPNSGNSNLGHSFEGDGSALPKGVLGRGLSPQERRDLIEYLKER